MHNSGRFAPSTEDLYAAAFEALPDPTVVVALQASGATIVAANELARRMPAARPDGPLRELLLAGCGMESAQVTELDAALRSGRRTTHRWVCGPHGAVTLHGIPMAPTTAPGLALVHWTRETHRDASLFSMLADHLPDPVFVLDMDSQPPLCIAYVNRAATTCYGYTADELLGQSVLTLIDSPSTAGPAPERIRQLRAGEIVTFEGTHRRCDGTELPVEARACLISWQGKPAVLAIAHDLTTRRRVQHDLAMAVERLQLALAAGRMGTFDWDVATNRIVWSAFHYELFGYPPDQPFEVTFEHFRARVHPDDLPGLLASVEAARTQRTEYAHLARVVRPDGSVRWFFGNGRFHYDAQGQAIRMLGVVRDETESHAAAERLRESERFLTAVIEGSPLGIQVFTPDGTSARMNTAMQQLLGIPSREVGIGSYNVLEDAEAQRTGIAAMFRECVAGKTTHIERREVDFSAPEYEQWPLRHRRFWLECVFFPVFDAGGAVRSVVIFNWDVTERVEAERTRQRLEDQLRHAQKLEAIGMLAGGVAHDFNNVLTAVMGFSDMLRGVTPASDPNRDLVDQIRLAADRGSSLTRQLLAFSRKQLVRAETFDPAAEIDAALPMLRRLLESNVTFDVRSEPAGRIYTDRGQFQQVLLNLVVNARDAMPQGGRLTIRTTAGQLDPGTPAVRVSVTDTGVGMTEATKGRLFEPFFTTKEPGRGTGLGLATVHGIVSQAGGRIEIDSQPGKGTAFHILWPRTEAPTAAAKNAVTTHATRKTLLLVDDDAANRDLAAKILVHEGYDVRTAASGEQALEVHGQMDQLDLLVSDVVMPGMGGRALADRLVGARPGLEVVLMSGYSSDTVLRDGASGQRFAFLQKPYSADQLARIVRTTLDHRPDGKA